MLKRRNTTIRYDNWFIGTLLTLFLLTSCKKGKESIISQQAKENLETNVAPIQPCSNMPTVCEDCDFQETSDDDTIGLPTVLGSPYLNPYSISNISQAYFNMFGVTPRTINPTHKYVRINCTDINLLDNLESQDVELYDYPLNYNIVQEGEYYPQAYTSVTNEYKIPILYAVIEKDFVIPAGINYEVFRRNVYT
jgi:hypothetical protein